MKTIENFLRSIFSETNWDYDELEECSPELVENIKKETEEFIREAIRADRKNVVKHSKVDYFEEDSSIAFVDKDSILNAPEIELK